MKQYGRIAILAVKSIGSGLNSDPKNAWDNATKEVQGRTEPDTKGCPRNTFLSLCETGKVKGVDKGTYTGARQNKSYALKALALIEQDQKCLLDIDKLWLDACDVKIVSPNGQMDVITALFEADLISGH